MGFYKVKGKQKSAGTFDTWDGANDAAKLAEALAAPVVEVTVAPAERRGKLTVAGYTPEFMSRHKMRETTAESYGALSKHIVRHVGGVCLADLSPAIVETLARTLENDPKIAASAGKVIGVLNRMCAMAVRDGKMDANPCTGVKAGETGHTEMRILTRPEYAALAESIPVHYRLLLETLISTGMRWGEVLAVKADAVIRKGKTWVIRVKRSYAEVGAKPILREFGKTRNAMRDVSIPEHLAKRLLAACGVSGDGFAFHAYRGGFLTRAGFRRVFKAALRAAGIDPATRVHDIRHTHATWLLADGVPLIAVRDRLGHSNIAVTSRYLHLLPSPDDPALGAVERFNLAA
jgi:integrase